MKTGVASVVFAVAGSLVIVYGIHTYGWYSTPNVYSHPMARTYADPDTEPITRGMFQKTIEDRIGGADQCAPSSDWLQAGYEDVQACYYGISNWTKISEDSDSTVYSFDAKLVIYYYKENGISKVLDYSRPALNQQLQEPTH